MKLIELWHFNAGNAIHDLVFSDNGNLGVSSINGCALVLDPKGKFLEGICRRGWMNDASFCCGKFGFINYDDHVYITDENGNLIKKVYVGRYDKAITMTEDGFMACRYRCAFFDFDGNKLCDFGVGWVRSGPSYYKGYWYVADGNKKKLLIVKNGKVINEIGYGERAYDTAVCGRYLAVSTHYHLYLYDLCDRENPNQLWEARGLWEASKIAFSPDCKHIAVANIKNHKLKIYDIEGNLVLDKEYNQHRSWHNEVWAVAWWKDRLAVGLANGDVYMYKVVF